MKNIDIIVRKNEERVFPYVWINGDDKEVVISARLVGEGANLTIIGIFLGADANSIAFHTNVTHESSRTKSLTHIHGIFRQRASINNNGLVRINKGAKGADGYFSSKILLFDDAMGRSVPSLEIDENELKAGHASTVGRPDEQQIFYLRSRGLTLKEAEELIVAGFFEPAISLFPSNKQVQLRREIAKELKHAPL